jgi:hypothetical protein
MPVMLGCDELHDKEGHVMKVELLHAYMFDIYHLICLCDFDLSVFICLCALLFLCFHMPLI